MKIIGTGDAILTRRLSKLAEPCLQELREVFAGSDAAFTNLETPLPRAPLVPGVLPQGMHVHAGAFVLDELSWLGFDVMNLANNHAVDFSLQGLTDTVTELREHGIPFAGAGMTLGEARAPAFLDTPNGRLALIGVASSNAAIALGADPRPDMGGRPGINPLRYATSYELTPEQFDHVRQVHASLGLAATQKSRVAASRSRSGEGLGASGAEQLTIGGSTFVRSTSTSVATVPDERDVTAVETAVAEARAQADTVVVSIHGHEGIDDGWNSEEPAAFLVEACRRWIRAGADVVLGHGPHCLRGAEIYQGKPIFYSLGNFLFTLETVAPLPYEAYEQQLLDPVHATPAAFHDAAVLDAQGAPKGFLAMPRFWESVLAVVDVSSGATTTSVVPVRLSQDVPRGRRGIPAIATGEVGRQILERFGRLSEPFGTKMSIETVDDRLVGVLT